ncbi:MULTISPECIES: FGGY family carbohydrate kinase [Bacteria]|uniref:FGGY family carbohydrate kinase n=1 Tax=Bacteria TaxID=2 RepID=UPI003C79E079
MNPRSPVVVAVDAGTGSARAIAFDAAGSPVAHAAVEWSHAPVPGHPGGTAFDAVRGWEAVCTALRQMTADLRGREIAAVAASSMREGFVLYDGEGAELFACPNTDGRARVEADELVAEGLADEIYATGGDWVSITAPARIRWIARHRPEILTRARHLGMLSDWVNRRLTGEYLTDPTCGSSTALFDVAARTWSADLAERSGIDPRILPPVLEPGARIGGVTPEAATQTGLPVGTPVVMGGADTQLALHAIAAGPGRPTIVAGTFWQTTAVVTTPVIDPLRRTRTLCHVSPSSWMVEGIGFLSGLAMRWFRDAFCPDAIDLARGGGVSAFDVMESWAADVPVGCDGLVAVLSDVMQADAWHHATPALVGFDISDSARFHRGTVVRAIEEAAAFVADAHLGILDELTAGDASSSGEVAFTGGSSAGVLWPRVVAGATGRTTRTTEAPEATSYGAARLAGSAVGLDLPPLLHEPEPVVPAEGERDAYRAAARRWREVYDAQRAATVMAGTPALFTPPGAARPAIDDHGPTTKEKHHG